jgi:DNA-binding LacI/PurR family transcriptional regulator
MRPSEKLIESLREVVLAKAPNAKLPSVRVLMKRYGVSLYSVNLALRRLADEELLDIRHGSGIYVRARMGGRYIEFHRPQYPSISMDIKELSLERAVRRAGWRLLVKHHDFNTDDTGQLLNPIASAHVVIPGLCAAGSPFMEQIRQQSTPVVLAFGHNYGHVQLDHIMGNDHQYFNLLIKHFLQLGHRRIALLQNEPPHLNRSSRNELFSDIMNVLDLPALIIDCGTQRGESSMQKAYEGLARHLASQRGDDPGFTALIVGSVAGITGTLRALHEAGLSVPRDCSIASLGMEIENAFRIPSITEVGVPDDMWGEGTVGILQRRFAEPSAPPMAVKLEPTLAVRESSAPPPTSHPLTSPRPRS